MNIDMKIQVDPNPRNTGPKWWGVKEEKQEWENKDRIQRIGVLA